MTIPTAADVDAAVKKPSARENDNKAIIDIPLLKTLLKNIVSSIGSAITGDVPVGGTTGQVLTKASNANLDADWEDVPSGEIDPAALAALGVPYFRRVTLDVNDILSINDAAFELIPAQGENKLIYVTDMVAFAENNIAFTGIFPSDATGGQICIGASSVIDEYIYPDSLGGLLSFPTLLTTGFTDNDAYLRFPLYQRYIGSTSTRALTLKLPHSSLDDANMPITLAVLSGNVGTIKGAIATSQLSGGGSGFAALDTFTVDGGAWFGSAEGVVDTVDGGGAIVTYHLTNNVNGYLVGNGIGITATSGAGSGGAIDILSLDYSANEIIVTFEMLYRVRTLVGIAAP